MIRVTIESVPYGMEHFAKTISEICIEIVNQQEQKINYEAAGYIINENKIQEIAKKLETSESEPGVLELIKEILSQETLRIDDIQKGESLLHKTRLANLEVEEN